MVLRSCQHIDVLWSWTNLPGLRLVILLLVLRTSESGGHWALGNGWESISIELQSPAVSIRALAGLWWVIRPERDLFDQWPHLIMCPLCPFIKVTTALRLIFILNLTSCQQKQKLFFLLQFFEHVKPEVWERNECANEYFCWNIHHNKVFICVNIMVGVCTVSHRPCHNWWNCSLNF